jgi:acyl-CoA thioesterase
MYTLKQQQRVNKMSYKVLKEDGLYVVIDELKNVLHVCEKRSEATAMVRELNTAVKSNVKHVEGTYGTGVERVVETAAVEEQVETAATEQVVEQVETAATEQVEVAEQVKQQVVTVVAIEQVDATGKALKKSERVRIRIAIAKQNNETQEDVIKWTMDDIGFARGLAKVYVQNNWNKV